MAQDTTNRGPAEACDDDPSQVQGPLVDRLPRIVAIMGSGETAPTMVRTHQQLLARLPASARAVLVETPYGFQENAGEISQRTTDYFRRNVGRTITPVGPRTPADTDGPDAAAQIARLQDAGYIFAGPGSPTYALEQWRDSAFVDVLAGKLRTGGIVIFASAAAVGLGRVAVPVYEIYKVGRPPRWVPGLDLLAVAGLDAAVIPHFDNAEGGTHDTRFCYLGARRLDMLEQQLGGDTVVIGVDEHTALILDLDAQTALVQGRGGVTVRRNRQQVRQVPAGSEIPLALLSQGPTASAAPRHSGQLSIADEEPSAGKAFTLSEHVQQCTGAFDAALRARDASAAGQAILELEATIAAWSADPTQTDEADRARSVLRGLITRLGDAAASGLADPAERIAPLAEVVVRTRAALRQRREFDVADALRDQAADAGLELRDTPDGTTWHLTDG